MHKTGSRFAKIQVVLQVVVVVGRPCSTAEAFRRRAQVLTCVEHLALLYRALLPVPVWYMYFEASKMGRLLCAMTAGGHTMASDCFE